VCVCRYRLHQDAVDRVRIDPVTGDIISVESLDHETSSFLRFHVLATDDTVTDIQDESRVASALVIVAVLNVDDELPRFEHRKYTLSVPENQPEMTLVGHVVARDADAPPYDELRYQLNGGVDADAFVLDPKTGSLRTRKMLDRERKSEYHVTVMAESVGRAARAFANVTVRVGDLNDHAPVIISPSGGNGSVHVSSSALPGRLVTRIRAVDADQGPNARLTYDWNSRTETETKSTPPPPFRVEPQTGSVYLTESLNDVPDGTTYKLHVLVRDNGMPPTASTASLYIVVDRDIIGAERSRSGAATAVDAGGEKFRFVLEGKFQLAVVIGVIVLCIILAGALLAAIVVCRRRRTRCPPEGAISDTKQGDHGLGAAIQACNGDSADDTFDAIDVLEPVLSKLKPKPLAAVVTVAKNDRLQVLRTFSYYIRILFTNK